MGGSRTPRLVVLDHVTSNTGMIMPLQALCAVARAHGAAVLVDGAHGPGQEVMQESGRSGDKLLDIGALAQIGVDFYVGNFHKWCCAPRGAAFLWAAPRWHSALRPQVLS